MEIWQLEAAARPGHCAHAAEAQVSFSEDWPAQEMSRPQMKAQEIANHDVKWYDMNESILVT